MGKPWGQCSLPEMIMPAVYRLLTFCATLALLLVTFGSLTGCGQGQAAARGEDGRIPPTALIGAYPAVEKYGLVWTCLDDDPMLEVPDLADLDQLGYTFMNADPIETSAGFVNSLENFRDVAHLPFVHRASIGQFQPGEVAPLEVETSGYESRMVRILPVDDESAGGGAYGAADGLEVTYHTIAPSLTSARLNLGAMGQRIVMECFQPIGLDGACRIFLVSGTAADYTATTPAEALEMELTVLREDVPILNGLVPPEVPILHDEPEVSTASDRYTLASRQAILAFARDAADTAGSTPVAFDSTS